MAENRTTHYPSTMTSQKTISWKVSHLKEMRDDLERDVAIAQEHLHRLEGELRELNAIIEDMEDMESELGELDDKLRAIYG